jgi:hypothetical protein
VIKKLLLREVFDVDAWQRCLPALAAMQFILCLPKDSLSNIPVEELAGNLDLVEAAPNIEFRVLYLGAFAQHLSQTDHNDFATKLKDAYNERSRKLSLGKSGDLYRIFERVAEPSLVMQERDFNWLSQTVLAGSFAVRAAATRARAKISTRINPSRSQDHREREILQYAALVRSHLAFAKGPLTKFVQALPFLEAMLPPKIAAELRSLEEQPRALDGTVAQAIVESELGLPINQLFAEWHSTPIAAASLGQVHRARLKDGRVVAVKVQFPQLRTLLSRQVSAMKIIAPAVGAIFSSVDT